VGTAHQWETIFQKSPIQEQSQEQNPKVDVTWQRTPDPALDLPTLDVARVLKSHDFETFSAQFSRRR